MTDIYKGHAGGLESPAVGMIQVTPSDSVDLPVTSRAINTSTDGLVYCTFANGDEGPVYVAAGGTFPARVVRIWATGTTATGIAVLY